MAIWDIREANNLERAMQWSRGNNCLFGGGQTPSATTVVEEISIVSAGNATDFGDIISAGLYMGANQPTDPTKAFFLW